MTRTVREVVPATPGVLTVYACGPTVYRYAHVGNLRTFLLTDLIRRTAEVRGLRVRLVQNITDVGHLQDDTAVDSDGEDKLLVQARLEDKSPFAIARFYEDAFHRDLRCSACDRPTRTRGRRSGSTRCCSWSGGWSTPATPTSGTTGRSTSRRSRTTRTGSCPATASRTCAPGTGRRASRPPPASASTPTGRCGSAPATQREMTWDSPWGRGFPGWHTECSAMSLELLGDTHRPAHRRHRPALPAPRGRARAEQLRAVGREVVGHWVHGEHLLFEGRKMAKSTGNVVLVSDVVERGHDPLALRLAFLSSRYRQQANLSWDAIAGASKTLDRWRAAVAGVGGVALAGAAAGVGRRGARGLRGRPGHPPRAAGAAAGREGRRRSTRAPCSSSSPGRTGCWGWTSPATSAGRSALPGGRVGAAGRRAPRRGPARTSPRATGCATSWPRWASPSRTPRTARSGPWPERPPGATRHPPASVGLGASPAVRAAWGWPRRGSQAGPRGAGRPPAGRRAAGCRS